MPYLVSLTRNREPLFLFQLHPIPHPSWFGRRLMESTPSQFCDCCVGVVKRPHCAQLAVGVLRLEETEFSTPLPFRKDLLDFSLGSFRALFGTQLALRYLGKHAGNDKRVRHLVYRRA